MTAAAHPSTTLSLPGSGAARSSAACLHCGSACPETADGNGSGGNAFCCHGCQTVYELLAENGLGQFYELSAEAGRRIGTPPDAGKYHHLDDPQVRSRLVDFDDGKTTRVTLRLPAIHCVACVWLLENLFRLRPGIGSSRVNFARQEAVIAFDPAQVRLGEVAALLDSIGYEPDLKLANLDGRPARPVSRRLWLQLGVAGFVFGNTMLFSLPAYFGLDSLSGPGFRALVGWLSLGLAVPVVAFSAADYFRNSWLSIRHRRMTIDVPIAVGISVIFLQSAAEVLTGRGVGFFDSLAGLTFFLLCGRVFQQKTYDRLAFDRDYRSFFPLSVIRRHDGGEERISLGQVGIGDRLLIRHGELVPADARLLRGEALIDYSFVTGEADPVSRSAGELLYAGGRQSGGAIEVVTVKPVSQSYLTSLWNQDAFRKDKDDTFNTLTNRYSRLFTWAILAIALTAAAHWLTRDPHRALRSFTGVLIVACPCALALAAPFTLGAGLRALARRNIFVRNAEVLESLARVDAVVFDKTGTLTAADGGAISYAGTALEAEELAAVAALARQSTHPLSRRLADGLPAAADPCPVPEGFREVPGGGVEATVRGRGVRLGSHRWFESLGLPMPAGIAAPGSAVWVALDGVVRGAFVVASAVRPETGRLLARLAERHEIALLSGDTERDRTRFAGLFGPGARLQFNQSPLNKLGFIRDLQASGRTVMMVGDGLNDAGALRQSDVGIAVVEQVGAFSPASDVILDAALVPRIAELLRFARQTTWVVRLSFAVSALYNAVGLAIAAGGNLSPVVCAVLMPVSSVTVVALAVGLTRWLGRRAGLDVTNPGHLTPTEGERA